MTVYVDDTRIKATVGRYSGRWSHLYSDDNLDELHELAARIGLHRSWFEVPKPLMDWHAPPIWRFHYDVTEPKRLEAISAGATPMSTRDWMRLLRERRATLATTESEASDE